MVRGIQVELSGPKPVQLGTDGFHQRYDRRLTEVKADAGGGEELGEWTGTAEAERLAIGAHGAGAIVQGAAPDSQCAQLGDPVFDVVERVQEDMQLAVPTAGPRFFVSRPVDVAAKAIEQGQPCRASPRPV